jgi:hypothetical protein
MPEKQLIQKHWTEKNVVIIKNDHINFQKKTLQEDIEYKIKFEDLGFGTYQKVDKRGHFLFYLFLALTLASIFEIINGFLKNLPLEEFLGWSIGVIFFGFISFWSLIQLNKETIYLTGGHKNLELMATKPDRQTVLVFIDEIHRTIRKYYKRKYTNFDRDTPYEEKVLALRWLKQINAITDEELSQLKVICHIEANADFDPDTE